LVRDDHGFGGGQRGRPLIACDDDDVMSQTQGDAPPAGRLSAPPLLAAVAVDGATYLIIPALVVPPGKRLLRLQVIDQRTRALPSPRRALVVLNLILLIIPSHRPVHDRLTRTVVRDQKMVVTP
jgi:hypothetical protein